MSASLLMIGQATGCSPKRGPNLAVFAGGRVAPALAEGDSGTVGGIGAELQAAESENSLTAWGQAEVAFGGNVEGFAGQLSALAEVGVPLRLTDEQSVFARAGFSGELERNPYNGLFLLEIPKATLGYQYHGREKDFLGTLHLDIGATGGLATVGRAFFGDETADVVGAPEVGAVFVMMGEFLTAQVRYDHLFEHEGLDIVRSEACFLGFFGLCLDVRNTFASVASVRRGAHFIGINLGFGLASGLTR